MDFGAQLDGFFLILEPNLVDFGTQLDGFWDPTWWILGPNLHDSATALVPKGAWPLAEGT